MFPQIPKTRTLDQRTLQHLMQEIDKWFQIDHFGAALFSQL